MKLARLLCLVLAVSFAGRAQKNWIILFDGSNRNQWDDPRQKTPPGDGWTVEDGCLKAMKSPRIVEDLVSKKLFGNFELELEWRISPGGNSGIKYRIQDRVFLALHPGGSFEDLVNYSIGNRPEKRPDKGQEYVVGFEYQILDNATNVDARHGADHQAGALYDIAGPAKDVTRPAGEFNQTRLVVRGNHVEHWLNGVKVVDTKLDSKQAVEHIAKRWGQGSPVYNLLTKQPKNPSPISLQNHGSEAWFRAIRIRELEDEDDQ
jgi:hypothetical protein